MILRPSEPRPLTVTCKSQPNRSARSCGYRFPGCCQRVFHIDHAVWLLARKYSRTGMRCLPPAATTLAASPSTSGSWAQKRKMPVFQYSKLFCGFSALRTQRSLPIRSPVDRCAIRNEPQPPPFGIYSCEPAEAWSRVFHSDSSTPPSRSARVTLREMTAGILPMMPTRKILPPINTSTSASAYLR